MQNKLNEEHNAQLRVLQQKFEEKYIITKLNHPVN